MKVDRHGDGWAIVADDGSIVETFETQAQAFRYIDRNEVRPLYLSGKTARRLGAYSIPGGKEAT